MIEHFALPGDLDKGIAKAVQLLHGEGIETYESCEGGEGHSYPEPTIRFFGGSGEGFKAFAIAVTHGLDVKQLRRSWQVIDGELTGPTWELVFWGKVDDD